MWKKLDDVTKKKYNDRAAAEKEVLKKELEGVGENKKNHKRKKSVPKPESKHGL